MFLTNIEKAKSAIYYFPHEDILQIFNKYIEDDCTGFYLIKEGKLLIGIHNKLRKRTRKNKLNYEIVISSKDKLNVNIENITINPNFLDDLHSIYLDFDKKYIFVDLMVMFDKKVEFKQTILLKNMLDI